MSCQKVECVIIVCDNCEEHFSDYNDFSIFPDEQSAHPEGHDWHVTGDGKHYCPKCHKIDDNDNLIITTLK